MKTHIVETNSKRRFIFSDDGKRIRANQGHSVKIDLGLTPIPPPETLYHGTATRFLDSIRVNGLIPGSRQHLHLSDNLQTATQVGSRHGTPIILNVKSALMHQSEHHFHLSENGVWLTDSVPVEFIEFPASN
jgi:putative RNA 2'-phosphotransferase